jgi:hypothetical protein
MEKVSVSRDALRQVLQALIGPPHHIRELQVTIGPLFQDNPITVLVNEFNEQVNKEPADADSP